MSKVRVCFLGTPEFAVVCLKALLEDEHYEVVAVVTQPDRPAGRKMQLTPSPVKTFALSRGLNVISPESVNKEPMLQEIEKWGAEVGVVVAFGQILSNRFLQIFPKGCVNVHGSILPKWRGAAPIQRALEAGDVETGVTLQKVVKELDAGDILGIRRRPIDSEQTAADLYHDLALLGADLLHVELMDYLRGNLAPTPQDPSGVTYAKKIEKTEGEIDWKQSAAQIHNKVRAFNTGPGTFTTWNDKKLKIHKTRVISQATSALGASSLGNSGQVYEVSETQLFIATGSGVIEILELQPESRNRMAVKDFLKSHPLKKGDSFGHS